MVCSVNQVTIFGIMLILVALLCALTLGQNCKSCNNCAPVAKCSCSCPDLQAAFDDRNPFNLIVQANVTITNKNNGEQSFLARILKTYQGTFF